MTPPNDFASCEGGYRDSPVTLCEWCGKAIPPTRKRGSPRRFCSPKHKVAAHRARKQGVRIEKPRRRKTRRTDFPRGCWQHQDACLVLHHDCSCRRCRYNVCECIQVAPAATTVSVAISGLLVRIPGRYQIPDDTQEV